MEKYIDYLSEICIKTGLMTFVISPFWKYFEWNEVMALAVVLAIIQPRFGDDRGK